MAVGLQELSRQDDSSIYQASGNCGSGTTTRDEEVGSMAVCRSEAGQRHVGHYQYPAALRFIHEKKADRKRWIQSFSL